MRFIVDASSDARLVPRLKRQGYDVTRVGTDYPADLKDDVILAIAVQEQRVLITDDRDFGELVFRLRQPHAGVIYLRLDTVLFEVRARRVDEVLAAYGDELDQFLVVTEESVRIRRKDDGGPSA
jgi:predicted nuclease of predicted toxin-antitoxin system